MPLVLLGVLAGWLLLTSRRRDLGPHISEHFREGELAVSAHFPDLVELPTGQHSRNAVRGVRTILQPLRTRLGVPVSPTSFYRGPALNAAVRGVPGSHHTRGLAADIKARGYTDEELIRVLWDMHQAGELPGLGEVITYEDTGHLHVSWTGPVEFLVAYRNAAGERRYRPWRPS